jgi:hypothetical protein
VPSQGRWPETTCKQLVEEAHLMIKLTAIAAFEEEPHSTVAVLHHHPDLSAA